ncbi:integrase, partial [Saccharopolyspora sp. NPDC050389]
MVRSCEGCLAWGQTFGQGLCVACYMFARDHAPGVCVGCGRHQPIRKDYCRLCWNQARTNARESGESSWSAKAVHHLKGVRHHQLFFADMRSMRGSSSTPPARHKGRGRPRKPDPEPAARPVMTSVQLRLVDGLARDYSRFNEHEHRPPNPWLNWGHYVAYRLGEARGWTRRVSLDVQRALVILLSGHIEGDVVRYSEMFLALRALGLSSER